MARGFTPDSGATWLLPRLVGVARAKELLLLGEKVTGAQAAEWGMIHRSVPDDEVASAAEALVSRLAQGPTVAIGLAKRCIQSSLELVDRPRRWRRKRWPWSSRHAATTSAKGSPPSRSGASRHTGAAEQHELRDHPLRRQRPDRDDHVQPTRPAERDQPADGRRAPRRLRRRGSGRRRVDAPRDRERASVLRGRRRGGDPRRRARHLPGAVPLDLPAVGGAAGGDASVPLDDQAGHHRGERDLLRRGPRPADDRGHLDRLRSRRVLRPAREHRAGLGARVGATRPRAAARASRCASR